jgi:ABC-type Fe3+ transport system substrate-binding protein
MNKRIRQLWEDNDTIEVCYPEQGSPVSVSAKTLETFAQLIVKV